MSYKYYNQFNLSQELGKSISYIISQKEEVPYICKPISVRIPEHKSLVFSSPLDGYNPWGGGLNALSGGQIAAINEKFGKYVEKTIPAKNYVYLAVMDKESHQTFLNLSFENENEIKNALNELSSFYAEYYGIFDSSVLCERFPYLQGFFAGLDNWRAETGRVTLDNDILRECIKKTLAGDKPSVLTKSISTDQQA